MRRIVEAGLLALKFVSTDLGGGKVKVAAVDGAPTNNPLNALVCDCAQCLDVLHIGQAAGGYDRNAQGLREFDRGLDVDAAEHAVTPNVCVDDGFDAVVLEFLAQVEHVMAGEFAPAVRGHLAFPGVQPNDDVATKGSAGVL